MPKVKINSKRSSLSPQPNSTLPKLKKFAFTLEDDILLLKSCLQHNPFQLGKDKWMGILEDFKTSNLRPGQSIRGMRDRLQLLVTKYQSEQLTSRTGTEESKSERAELLDEIIRMVAEAESTIDHVHGQEDEQFESEQLFDESDVLDVVYDIKPPVQGKNAKKKLTEEKKSADAERAKLLDEVPPSPNGIRGNRATISAEAEMVKLKVVEDVKLENRKLDLEEKKMTETFLIEKEKLALEQRKEDRLADESKRRDEMTASQLKFQSDMFELMKLAFKGKE